jgi:hypothetical protein
MVLGMMGIGWTINKMVKERKFILMEPVLLVNIKLVRNMEKANFFGLINRYMRGNFI